MTESQRQQAAQLQQVLAQQPDHVPALFGLGTLMCQAGDWTGATQLLARAVQIDPNHADAWNNLGTALRNSNRIPDAIGAYRRSLECRESVLAHENLTTLLIAINDLQGAVSHARRTVELDATRSSQHCMLAIVLGALGRLSEAREAAQRAVSLDENSIEARLALSATLRDTGDPIGAEKHARAAISLNPNHLQARLFAAQAVWKQGRLAEAADEFQGVLKTAPADPTANATLASIRHAQSRLSEAAMHARMAIERDPKNARVCNTLANVLANQGRLTEAIAAFRQALRVDPNYLVAHSNLCLLLHFDPDHTPRQVLQENVEWSRRHELPVAPAHVRHVNDRNPIGGCAWGTYRRTCAITRSVGCCCGRCRITIANR
jgi:Flp pilus assembly protein TadD